MLKCSDLCIPCCDYCIYVLREWYTLGGKAVTGGPVGCNKHRDKKHQDIAFRCGYCDDFHCTNYIEER